MITRPLGDILYWADWHELYPCLDLTGREAVRGQEGMMTAEHKMLSRLGRSPSKNNALTASYNVILSSISFSSRMLDPSHAEVAAEPCWQALGPG